MFDKMKMKEALLDELLEDLEMQESDKLKPKAAMIAVGHSEPDMDDAMMHDAGKDDEDDDDLKMLLSHYSKG